MDYKIFFTNAQGETISFGADTKDDTVLKLNPKRIFEEAEDFEIIWGSRNLGRFMVNSVEPYEVNITEELELSGGDPYAMIDSLIESGRIITYSPNYSVEISMFDNSISIKENK